MPKPQGQEKKATGKTAKPAKEAKFQDKNSAFDKEWQVERTLPEDSPFGVAYVMAHVKENTTNLLDKKHVLMKEYITSSSQDANAHTSTMKHRMELVHANLQTLEDWSGVTKSDWCSSFYKFKAFYNYPEHNLRQRIGELKDQPVPHEELTHVMYQILHALNYLHGQGIAFNDVRPEYVGAKAPGGKDWMLCDRLRYPGNAIQSQRENFQAVVGRGAARRLYTAPEVWTIVTGDAKKAPPKIDEARADVWSFGMMLLSSGLGLKVAEHNKVYQARSQKAPASVNQQQIDQWISQFKHTYEQDQNSILGLVVEECLRVDPAQRPTTEQIIKDHLPPYEEVLAHFGGAHPEPHVGHQKPAEPQVHTHTHVPAHTHVTHTHEPVHHHHEVVRHSHPGEENVRIIRGEPIVTRKDPVVVTHSHRDHEIVVNHGDHHHHISTVGNVVTDSVAPGRVVTSEPRVVVGEPRVIRRDPVVTTSHRESEVIVNHGDHHHHVVTGEPRVIRGEPRVIHREGSHREGEVRRVSRVVQGEVRRSDAHVVHAGHDDVVTHTHVMPDGCTETHSHVVHHEPAQKSNVRVIRDPAEVAAYKEKMAREGKTFTTATGTSHVHSHVPVEHDHVQVHSHVLPDGHVERHAHVTHHAHEL